MTRAMFVLSLLFTLAVTTAHSEPIPAVALTIVKSAAWECSGALPAVGQHDLVTTYDGVGKVDAFVVFYNFKEARGVSFAMEWPEAWGEGSWHDCGDLRLGKIQKPGEFTSVIWQDCKSDEQPLIAGWLTVTATSPGQIKVIPSPKEGAIAILDCDLAAPQLSEAMISLKGGLGGIKGDPPSRLTSHVSRRWLVRPDASGDAATIDSALRQALPGDTVMVEGGTYHGHVILRRGVRVLGSYNADFSVQDLDRFPSTIDASPVYVEQAEGGAVVHEAHAHEMHSAVEATLGADSTTVFDRFVVTGGNARQGGGIVLRDGAKPVLSNLIIHSNSASFGGGIFCNTSSPIISDCLIVNNEAELGGAIYCTSGSSPVITNTTIAANRAPAGAAVAVLVGSVPTIEKSIVAGQENPSAIYIQNTDSGLVLSCCDLWDNEPPQYGGVGEAAIKLRGNVSEDPGFVDPSAMNFTPGPTSPVRSVEGCGGIGTSHAALPVSEDRKE